MADETALDAPATAPVDEAADEPEAADDDPLTAAAPIHEVDEPSPMVTGDEYTVLPVESVNLTVIEVPAARSTVQVSWLSFCVPRSLRAAAEA